MASPSDAAQAFSFVFVKGGPRLTMYISGYQQHASRSKTTSFGRAIVANSVGVFEIRAGHERCARCFVLLLSGQAAKCKKCEERLQVRSQRSDALGTGLEDT